MSIERFVSAIAMLVLLASIEASHEKADEEKKVKKKDPSTFLNAGVSCLHCIGVVCAGWEEHNTKTMNSTWYHINKLFDTPNSPASSLWLF